MQKVKVHRYISGKRPEYAQQESSDDDSVDEDFVDRKAQRNFANRGDEITMDLNRRQTYDEMEEPNEEEAAADPRLRRLLQARKEDRDDDKERYERHRHIHEPEIVESEAESEEESDLEGDVPSNFDDAQNAKSRRIALASDSESDPELSDTEIENRRQRLRQKMLQQRKEEEVLMKEEEKLSESSEDGKFRSSRYNRSLSECPQKGTLTH